MNIAIDHPLCLVLLALCIPPLFGAGWRWNATPSLMSIPADRVSRTLDIALRGLAALPIAAIVLGTAGLHAPGRLVTREARGAHVSIVLDRSLSMDEPFALRGEKGQESKTEAATRMLSALVGRRQHDSFALVAFSTAPIPVMPLTSHRAAIFAAIAAMGHHALANTDIGAGLAMGLAQLAPDPDEATRVILLVSDGAGAIPVPTRDLLRTQANRLHVHLYYLYLRAGDDPPLSDAADGETDLDHPSGLSTFLQNLGVPYQGFEARDPAAVEKAVRRIEALETSALTYTEMTKRRDLDIACYAIAALCLMLSLLAQLAEREIGLDPVSKIA
jgi:mxaC protein